MLENDISPMPLKTSRTVASLEKPPKSVCVTCSHALWHITETRNLRVYCQIMNALVDENLDMCDGAAQEII